MDNQNKNSLNPQDSQQIDNTENQNESGLVESDSTQADQVHQSEQQATQDKQVNDQNNQNDQNDQTMQQSDVSDEVDSADQTTLEETAATTETDKKKKKKHDNIQSILDANQGYREFEEMKMKEKHKFSSGLLLGVFAGIIFTVTFLLLVFGFVYNAGYLHLNSKGQIYVQDTQTSDEDGIGDKVESKLNTLDSLLDQFYFEDTDDDAAAENIYKAYLESFGDKYTVYYTADEYKALEESTTGTFYGIGAVCQKNEDGSILISDAYEDAPAYKAGIRTGDSIVSVDDTSILDMDLSSAVALIKGEIGTSVKLEVVRDGETFTVSVVRDEVKEKTVEYEMLDNNIGYLQITQFETVTTQQFKDAIKELKKEGMESLVIDIRNNPGGVLQTVVNVLDEILPKGLIVYTEDKLGKRTEYKGKDSDELDVPLAVLVNGNSASASEIFAGAVQDYEKGQIIGTQTYGKGIVQTIKPLTDGSAIKFTIAKYYTPLGQDINGNGVTPDQVVELDADNPTTDTQLNAAIDYLMTEMQNTAEEATTK